MESKTQPKIAVLSGYGINCEHETKKAFELAGGTIDIVHVNRLIKGDYKLDNYQILAFPGGFSFGDDTGSGLALAKQLSDSLKNEFYEFVQKDKLAIGICNGFQVMANMGLLPALDGKYLEEQVALIHNDNARYTARWVDIGFQGNSPWTKNLGTISMPIAHGEGKFYAPKNVLEQIKEKGLISGIYKDGNIQAYEGMINDLEINPNGSIEDIASITDETGRLIGMMPHPERAINFTQLPQWRSLKRQYNVKSEELPEHTDALKLFKNGVEYFK